MKSHQAVERLLSEAERFTNLAKDLALKCLVDPYAPDVEKKKRLATEHALRAGTFKDAAAIVGQPLA